MPHTCQAPSALLPCSSILPQSMLCDDSSKAVGEKVAEIRPMLCLLNVPDRMYMFPKCYVGFCTPRRTIIDSKKKKRITSSY